MAFAYIHKSVKKRDEVYEDNIEFVANLVYSCYLWYPYSHLSNSVSHLLTSQYYT